MSLTKNPNRNVVNFAAGPSAMPYEVLEQAQREMLDFTGLGISVMEMSHRSAGFSKIINQAEINVRELLNVPQNYKILFLQGGGNGQFCAVPLNLINRRGKKSADYAVTGYWSDRAALEAKKYGNVNLVFPKLDKFDHIPPVDEWNIDPEASYLFICENETIHGVEYPSVEEVRRRAGEHVPIVSDCSSNLFTRPIDVSQYGCIFAGAQKNFGPAGVTLVIIREDLLGFQLTECPSIFDYKLQSGQGSLFQTPPTYGIYICGLVFEWLKKQGGIESVGKVNRMKADLVYETIDNSDGFYLSPIDKSARSRVTIPFRINLGGQPSEQLEKEFIKQGEARALRELKGHRSVGGIRAAIFNAISYEEVQLLVKFMHEFKQKHHVVSP